MMGADQVDVDFSRLISALAEQVGVADLKPDAEQACHLVFDGLPVSIRHLAAKSQILIYCVVGTIPEDQAARPRLYARLLEANFLFRKTGGAALAIDEASGLIAFQQLESTRTLDSVAFLDLLETYLQLAAYWKGEAEAPPARLEPAVSKPGKTGATAAWLKA